MSSSNNNVTLIDQICMDYIYTEPFKNINLVEIFKYSSQNDYININNDNQYNINKMLKNQLYQYTKLSDDSIKTICKYINISLFAHITKLAKEVNITIDILMIRVMLQIHYIDFNPNNIVHVYFGIYFGIDDKQKVSQLFKLLLKVLNIYYHRYSQDIIFSKLITGYSYIYKVSRNAFLTITNPLALVYYNGLLKPFIITTNIQHNGQELINNLIDKQITNTNKQ